MKFVVPFKIPAISSTSFATKHCESGLIIGIPPPTDASNKKLALFSFATARSSAPCLATSSLLDVTTLLPACKHLLTKSYAGFVPPITSTTTLTSMSFTMSSKFFVNLSASGLSGNSLKSRICLT